jgi:hypothetical protein
VINDPQVQTDGFIDLNGGMNSAMAPSSLPASACSLGLNVTFRGGKVATRPGFSEISLANGLNDGLSYINDEYQGAHFYFNPSTGKHDRVLVSCGGHILVVFLSSGGGKYLQSGGFRVDRLFPVTANGFADNQFKNNVLAEAHFCQAERFMIIQNGIDLPLIYDGNSLYQSGIGPFGSPGFTASIPIGRQMAYNHGRLFVALQDSYQISAGDLVYGGSTEQVEVVKSEAGESDFAAKITTRTPHGYFNGDTVYITGHSADPDINNNASGYVIQVLSATTFTIPKEIKVAGYGGYVKKVSSGKDTDLLRFTEINYLNEGGSFKMPASFGKITGMAFQAIGDTQSGQGDLLVFCEKGAGSFAVSVRRDNWKSTTGFQKVLFPDIGCTSGKSIVSVNSEIFWRSYDGIRSYTNARRENSLLGYVPDSNDIRTIIEKDDPLYLHKVSSAFFDNRLIVTCSPKQDLRGLATVRSSTASKPVTFQGMAVYDFASVTNSGAQRSAIWEGLWFNGDILQILSTGTVSDARCLIFKRNIKPDSTTGETTIWEFTKDLKYDQNINGDNANIISVVETKAFPFRSGFELKKLSKADLWLQELEGRCTMQFYFKPDQYPCWVDWHGFLECADSKSCINASVDIETYKPVGGELRYLQVIAMPPSAIKYFRLGYGPWADNAAYNKISQILNYGAPAVPVSDNPETPINESLEVSVKTSLESIGFNFSNGGEVLRIGEGTEWSPYVYNVYTKQEYPKLSIYPVNDKKGYEGSAVNANLLPVDVQPQFRTQVRLPTPVDPPDEKACDPVTKRPFRNGHEFQFRLKWDGYVKINKFLAYCYPLIEQVSADCP